VPEKQSLVEDFKDFRDPCSSSESMGDILNTEFTQIIFCSAKMTPILKLKVSMMTELLSKFPCLWVRSQAGTQLLPV
jgi:hypothetical protein